MGQVPRLTYGIVGDGRVARHFIHYFNLLRIPVENWSRHNPNPKVAECPVILILITDSQIEKFFLENQSWLKEKRVVHFSGSLVNENICSFHPLMTFTTDLYDLEVYKKIVFIGEKGRQDFETVFPDLRNQSYMIPQETKALYHALCVMAGNFSVMLWQNLFSELSKRWDIPDSAAFPYLEQVTKNLIKAPKMALTGPVQRGDFMTIERNCIALKQIFPDQKLLKIYNAFVENYK